MRLSAGEVQSIVGSVVRFLPTNFRGELLLFGSQVDDHARGGDIDLILIAEDQFANDAATADDFQKLRMVDYKIVTAIKQTPEINDRKIDFQIISRTDSSKAFYLSALQKSVSLSKWRD